jgi:hypothetical protein
MSRSVAGCYPDATLPPPRGEVCARFFLIKAQILSEAYLLLTTKFRLLGFPVVVLLLES